MSLTSGGQPASAPLQPGLLNTDPPTPDTTMQQQAIQKVKSSFSKLPTENSLFQQCASSKDGVADMILALNKRYGSRGKKMTGLVKKFHQYTEWLRNFAAVIDIAVQTQAGIGCPVWAPLRFVLEVSS
jgi:hypothetical protein